MRPFREADNDAAFLIFIFVNSLFSLRQKAAQQLSDSSITLGTRWMRERGGKEGGFANKYTQREMNGRFNFPD